MRLRHIPHGPRFLASISAILLLTSTLAAHAATSPAARTAFHPATFLPILEMPTEDVDLVVATTTNPTYPEMAIWPLEGALYFFNLAGGAPTVITTIGIPGANITGVDFVTDGTWGAFQNLGRGFVFSMSSGPGFTPALLSTSLLPAPVPSRRDIDPFFIPDGLAPAGVSVVFVSGNRLHCRALPTGAVRWDATMPSSFVEAVDPVYSPNGHIFAPTEGFMTVLNPATGAILSTTPLSGSLVREVDVRLAGTPAAPGPSVAWLPISGSLWMFDDTPGSVGVPLAPAIPIGSPLIEGNDMEIDPSGTLAYLPTLAAIVQVNLPALGLGATYPVAGMSHVRNHDAVFTPPGVFPAKWSYAMQGSMLIGDNVLFAPAPTVLPSPGITVDGVDAAYSDTPPVGDIFSIATLAGTNVYSATGVSLLGSIPRSPLAGVLRTDVDHKPGPVAGNSILQPTIGGLLSVSGFAANDWVVTTSTGLEVVDLGTLSVVEWISFAGAGGGGALAYRGGDAQPTFMAGAGPLEPAFSVDNVDQDFLTKCFEYKHAINRNPAVYARNLSAFYPFRLPYGPWGAPVLEGHETMNQVMVVVHHDGSIGIYDRNGQLLQTLFTGLPLGGLIFDYDNKVVEFRVAGYRKCVIDLAPLGVNQPATFSYIELGGPVRWYPVIDRMNGWEFVIERNGTTLAVYDHLQKTHVQSFTLPAKAIRAPQFDEQRKTLAVPLADRTVAFFNAHAFRVGRPVGQYFYTSAVLPGQVSRDLCFDLYNHVTIAAVQTGQLVILHNGNGSTLWTSPVPPHQPISPMEIDCYNNVGKGFYRNLNTDVYYEARLNLYPLAQGGVPSLTFTPLADAPYGAPSLYSRGVFDLQRIGANQVVMRHLHNLAAPVVVNTPLPMVGAPQLDRVNGYALFALQGSNLFWIDLFKHTRGLAGSSGMIPLPVPGDATDNIVFSTQTQQAVGSTSDGHLYVVDLPAGSASADPALAVSLPSPGELRADPFDARVVRKRKEPLTGIAIISTINMNPTREDPPAPPGVTEEEMPAPPIAECDTIPPLPVPALPPPPPIPPVPSDGPGIYHLALSGLEPGADVLAYMQSGDEDFDLLRTTYGTVDQDGICHDISIVGAEGESYCLIVVDAAGNASESRCFQLTTVGVPGGGARGLAFARVGRHPAKGAAQFRLSLPTKGIVEVTLYDVAGRRVRGLVDRALDAGDHVIDWDLRGDDGRARVGVFFARVRTDAGELTERVVALP